MHVDRNALVAAAIAAVLAPPAWSADPLAGPASTAPAPADTEGAVQEVIVTGTRQSGIKALDSPAPVQVVSGEELARTASTPDLIQTLAAVVPSLFTTTGGGDLSDLTLQAALRGLSPNDTLVLVNGKRRHTTANIGIAAPGPFAGGAGADLNFIPVDAIDHIEVLTDGAAAQYGSDAIAGVINIILKKGADGGNLQGSYGGYQDGGGKTDDISGNVGFAPYDGAFLNLTAESRNHGYTSRVQPLAYIENPTALGSYPVAGLEPIDANVLNAVP